MAKTQNFNPKAEDITKGAIVKTNLTVNALTVEIPIMQEYQKEVPVLDKKGQPKKDKDGNPETKTETAIRTGFADLPQYGRISDMGHPLKSKYAFKATYEQPLSKETIKINKEMAKDIKSQLDELKESDADENQIKMLESQHKSLTKKTKTVSFYPNLKNVYYVSK